MATTPLRGKTALCSPLIFACFSVCRIRGSDYRSTGWIPTCLEQAQGILCPRTDHHLLFGVVGNPDLCKYFTPSSMAVSCIWHLGEGRIFVLKEIQEVGLNLQMWTLSLTNCKTIVLQFSITLLQILTGTATAPAAKSASRGVLMQCVCFASPSPNLHV